VETFKGKRKKQCCESGSAWIRIVFGGLDLDPDPGEKFHVLKCWMFSSEG
jgi:hypothetical protein